MSAADGPLRDRVLFVEGAPRSGTSLLTALLAAHPEIAAVGAESHLFDSDRGVGALFDNYDGRPPYRSHLVGYLSRERLVELARALCDGVLEEMRSRTAPKARFVVEKTPASMVNPELIYTRKLECYPDGWFLHIVRDPGHVARSLTRAPWSPDRSPAASRRWRSGAVAAIRTTYRDHPRYREIGYEQLVADPVGAMDEVFEWLGLASDDDLRERVRLLAGQRYAEFHSGAGGPAQPAPWPRRARAVASRALARARSILPSGSEKAVGEAFAGALRGADLATLQQLADERLVVEVRSGDGDLRAEGDEAREALAALTRSLFPQQLFSESWTVGPGRSFATVLLSGLSADGTRVDLAWVLRIADGRILRVVLLSAGGLGPRPLKELPLDWSAAT
ncbi:MAG: sulfotransferase [Solirubrobacterales bacterium]